MGEISTIGLDLAKSVFQAHAVDAAGRIVLRWQIKRAQLLDQNGLRLHFGQQKCRERPQFGRIFRQRFGGIQHG